MKRPNQKVILQEPFGGEHIFTVRRTVHNIEDHEEYWTGEAVINKGTYKVQMTSDPNRKDTWFTSVVNWWMELVE